MSDDLKLQLILEAVNKTGVAFDQLKRDLTAATGGTANLGNQGDVAGKKMAEGMEKARNQVGLLGGGLTALAGRFLVLELGITHIGRQLNKLVFEFNATLETAELGIAAALMTNMEYSDRMTGKVLESEEALKAARSEAAGLMKQLQSDNLKTIATTEQLVRAFQETLPVAMARGFDTRQAREFTLAVVQAAGVVGVSLDMLAEETRSMLTGAIDPRTSRIATVLGLRNEDVREVMGNADALFNLLMKRLGSYSALGEVSQKTWAGAWSNMLDLMKMVSAEASKPLFTRVRDELAGVNDQILEIDEATGQIGFTPEFSQSLAHMQVGVEGLTDLIFELGEVTADMGGDALTDWLEVVGVIGRAFSLMSDAVEKARELAGLAPEMPPIVAGPLSAAAALSRQVRGMMGAGENYAGVPIAMPERPAPTGTPKPRADNDAATAAEKEAEKAAKAAAKLAEQWEKTRAAMALDVEKLGLDKYEARIADLTAKAADLREQFGAKGEIDTWLQAMIREVNSDKLTDTLAAAKGLAEEMAKEMREAADKARAAAEAERAARENALNLRLAEIDLAERTGQIDSGAALRERLTLNQELLDLQEAHLAQLDKLGDASAWYAQADAVNATRLNLVDLNDELLRQTGTFSEGWKRGLDDYVANADTAFEQAEGLAKRAAEGMESAFSDFFFDAFRGELTSLADYLDAFLQAVQRAMSDMLAQQAASSIASMVSGFFSPAGGGSTYQANIDYGAFSLRHDGGPVLPRFHTGGLLPDEVPIIAQTGERVLSREQNATFDRLAQFLDRGGAGGGMNVQVVNNTGTAASGRAERSQSNNGDILRIVLDKVDSAIGEGRFDKSLGVVYGLRRSGVPR